MKKINSTFTTALHTVHASYETIIIVLCSVKTCIICRPDAYKRIIKRPGKIGKFGAEIEV